MIVIDSAEPPSVFEAFEEKGIPYIKTEIRFYYCENCQKVYISPKEICEDCGSKNILSDRCGDFTNTSRSFLVERKTEGDFVASMLDKSLHSQAARMAKYFAGWKILLLQGFISVMVDNPHNKSIKNWIRSMRVTLRMYDVCMWQCDDLDMLIYELVRLDSKAGEKPQVFDKIDDKYTGWTDSKKIVCKLLDVSDKKADVLLDEFKSPIKIFDAILDTKVVYTKTGNPRGVSGPLESIKGFGPKFVLKNQRLLQGRS